MDGCFLSRILFIGRKYSRLKGHVPQETVLTVDILCAKTCYRRGRNSFLNLGRH